MKTQRVAYLVTTINGRWPQHPRLAEAMLDILCDVLQKDGFVTDVTKTTSKWFELPSVDVLKLRSFFGAPRDWNEIITEIRMLAQNVGFYKKLGDARFYGQGYYIARLVDTGKNDNFGHDLTRMLDAMQNMHDITYAIVPPTAVEAQVATT